MKAQTAYILGGLVFVVCAAIGVYYLIPNPNGTHFLASKVNAADPTHAVAFFALGIVALIAARFLANASASK